MKKIILILLTLLITPISNSAEFTEYEKKKEDKKIIK